MNQIRAPEFLNNLYRDMRDQRLLLPAAALVVALIAIPMLLSSSSSSAPPPLAAPAANAGKQTAAEPAVVTQQLGVTNYRKRLEQFKGKNPFRQKFAVPKVTPDVTQSAVTAPSVGSTGADTGTSSTFSTSTPAAPGSTTSISTPTTSTESTSTPPSSTEPTSSRHHHHTPKPVTKLIQRRIDVKVGRASNMRRKNDVEQLTFLPYAGKPLVAYLGTSENGKKAFFLVSTDVTSATGDGHCLSNTSTCQYLTLKEGQVESFGYGPDPYAKYRLRLLHIRDVVVDETQG